MTATSNPSMDAMQTVSFSVVTGQQKEAKNVMMQIGSMEMVVMPFASCSVEMVSFNQEINSVTTVIEIMETAAQVHATLKLVEMEL